MKPANLTRPVSARRAAAARANGAKSRGPVTAQGKANSCRNSYRHGLRAQTFSVDPASETDRIALLALYEDSLQPESEHERTLVAIMALAHWREEFCWKLETRMLNSEIRRLESLLPGEDPVTLMALAYRSLVDTTCALHIIHRLESRSNRQYDRAVRRLTKLRDRRAQSGASRISERGNFYERTQQVTENTQPPPRPHPGHYPDPKEVIVNERTQQVAENNTPRAWGRPSSFVACLSR
jgi:hypothetical protein